MSNEETFECTIEHGGGRSTKICVVDDPETKIKMMTVVQIYNGKLITGIGFPLEILEAMIHGMRQAAGFHS